ncbi:hypothetical protein [uncultured Aquimarina sp.]|uniref:LA_2272 family surface repeat-containing protein n=1 Tax=uncultured Aquimarina sp. TaxID=575652 RepID=UPI00261243FD|nr:hypothetical protein [uncultured Aquimarina sp.]
MKNKIVVLVMLLFSIIAIGQEHKSDAISGKVKSFSFSPIHSNVSQVNGLVVGIGHYENKKIEHQRINGVNVEALHIMPLLIVPLRIDIPINSIYMGLIYNERSDFYFLEDYERDTYLSMNGFNLSVGGFIGGANLNGLNISLGSMTNEANGVSIAPVINTSKVFNGLQISALANFSDTGKGMQLGISNVSENLKGIQIGVFNKTVDQRGFQFGLWNRNARRSLPFINWQFSKKKVKSKTS